MSNRLRRRFKSDAQVPIAMYRTGSLRASLQTASACSTGCFLVMQIHTQHSELLLILQGRSIASCYTVTACAGLLPFMYV